MVFSRDQVLKAPPAVYVSVAEFCAVIWKVPNVGAQKLTQLAARLFRHDGNARLGVRRSRFNQLQLELASLV